MVSIINHRFLLLGRIGGDTMIPTNRPEGLLLAVQQHIHFAKLLADNMDLDTQQILDGLSKSGMRLVTDEADVGLDAAKVYPRLIDMKADLRVVE